MKKVSYFFLIIIAISCSHRYVAGILKTADSSSNKLTNNLAIGEKVYASASAFINDSHSPGKARDSSLFTKWMDSTHQDKWLMYDLGAYCDITSFVLQHENGKSASKYKIQKSKDGIEWMDVINETGNTSDTKTYNVSLSAVRYVRYFVAAENAAAVSVTEWEVWGAIAKPLQWTLSFSDEFNEEGLPDQSKWDIPEYNRRNNPDGPDGFWKKGYAYQEKGNLVIKVDKIANSNNDEDAFDYASGAIRTKGRFMQRFGKFEMRAKLPEKQGWWVAF